MVQRGRPPPLQQCRCCCSPGPPCPLGFVRGSCVLLGTLPGRLCLSTSCFPQAHSIYSVPSVYGFPHHSAKQNVPPSPKLRGPHLAVACAGAALLAWTLPCALTASPFHLQELPSSCSLPQWFWHSWTSVWVPALSFPNLVPGNLNLPEPQCHQVSPEIRAAYITGLLWKQWRQQT